MKTRRQTIEAPCVLTLAAARFNDRPAQLGIALRYPPVQLTARPAEQLLVSGARADAAYSAALHFQAARGLPAGAEIELELAIPSQMGLGSTTLTGLSAVQAFAALYDLPDNPRQLAHAAGFAADDGLAVNGFAQGGLLAVAADGTVLARHVPPHDDEAIDWVLVLVLPRVPPGSPADLEEANRRRLWAAAEQLDPAAEQIVYHQLWPALETGRIADFGRALLQLQTLDPSASVPDPAEQAILAIMAAEGALAWGRAPTGLALYGLVEGAAASHRLRHALARRLGHTGGTIMATICDPQGARRTRHYSISQMD